MADAPAATVDLVPAEIVVETEVDAPAAATAVTAGGIVADASTVRPKSISTNS